MKKAICIKKMDTNYIKIHQLKIYKFNKVFLKYLVYDEYSVHNNDGPCNFSEYDFNKHFIIIP